MNSMEYNNILDELENKVKECSSNPFKIKLNVVNKSNNVLPAYKDDGDSGFDLRAFVSEQVLIKPFERKLIPTGLFFDIPHGFEIQVRPRSGLAIKYGITVLNTPGTVDAGYIGEVCIILINLGSEDFVVNNGDRIAQGVLCQVNSKTTVDIISVDSINKITERGATGFGDSGIK